MSARTAGLAFAVLAVACSGGGAESDGCDEGATQCSVGDAAAPRPDAGGSDSGPSTSDLLVVDTGWLKTHLDEVEVIDTRASFTGDFIPGALPLRADSLVDPSNPIGGQVAQIGAATSTLRALGLRGDGPIIVYGEPPEFDPARVVWALRFFGLDARYLDGGWAAWVDSQGPTETGVPVAGEPSNIELEQELFLWVDGDFVRGRLDSVPELMQLVDARSPVEFDAGRIPGARHVQWTRNLRSGQLLPEAENLLLYEGLDPSVTTVTYCLIGWRASVAWLALTRLGFEDVRVYDGSWAEWGSGGFPVETD